MEKQKRPAWAAGSIPDETEFCLDFYKRHPMIYAGGKFYDENGCIREEINLRQEVYRLVREFYARGLQSKVEGLVGAMRLELQTDAPRRDIHLIHMKNGTLDITRDFYDYKHICAYRLPVSYAPETYQPAQWLAFLDDLLEPEDILTLQEYLGYCLIPTNAAQKMLIIIGEGGEGKSRIGVAMRAVLGDAMKNGSVSKLENDRFARADLEDTLLMVDDDLKLEALGSTNYLKSIITADTPMDLERKGQQSYQGKLYCRLLAFGNGSLQAIHDRSYGFFRRQIILTAKPRDPDRVDDPYLGAKLAAEADSIFLWCLEGLQRLIRQDFRFTISKKAENNWHDAIKDSNNIVEFLSSTGYFLLDPEGQTSSKLLYEVYAEWCSDNACKPLSSRTFWTYLASNGHRYGLRQSKHIPIGHGKESRGFVGIRILSRV